LIKLAAFNTFIAVKKNQPIKKVVLGPAFYKLQKTGATQNNFGLDNSTELLGAGFGLYSTTNMVPFLGPLKTEFYRIALTRKGTVNVKLGLEAFQPQRNTIVFGFPGQVFTLWNRSPGFYAYYILFTEEFVTHSPILKDIRGQFPFMGYTGVQGFTLNEEEGMEIETLVHEIDVEIKRNDANTVASIELYVQLILLKALRSYSRQQLSKQETATNRNALYKRFIKLVGQHFLTHKKVSDYAKLLNVSADHLNRIIKSQSDKTAHELIDEMILMEAKALLKQTHLSIAEIAYQLEFSDPSHFNKFFKKLTGVTPLQYRESE
jgi:AraC-like DNA-binding protein